MKKKVLLTTIGPNGSANPGIQLALYYLKSYFLKYSPKKNLADIKIFSFSAQDKIETIIKDIKKAKPDIIGFCCYVWNILKIIKVARAIKKDLPWIKIMTGGPEVSPRARRFMKTHKFIDAVVIGEGERTFRELLECWLGNKTDASGVDGLAIRKNSKIILTKERSQITDLDEIPSPYLEGHIAEKQIKGRFPYIPTETMRGCPYRCYYCYYHKDFKKPRYFSLPRVERELKYLFEKEPNGVYLMDPTFNLDKKRAKEILRIVVKHNKKSNLHVELKAELLDEEMIDLLKEARVNFIEIGIQSTNKETLKLINRHFDPESFKKNVLYLNKRGMPYEVQLIDGLPADNYRTLKKSLDWLFALRPRNVKIMRFMLLPGTYLRVNACRFGIKYNPKAPYRSIKSNTFSQKDIKKTMKLRVAMTSLYKSALLKNTMYPLSEKLGIGFSEIFENWNNWSARNGGVLSANKNKEKDKRVEETMRRLRAVKSINHVSDFVKYICRKYKKPNMVAELSRVMTGDTEAFLKRLGISRKPWRA